MKLRAAAAAVMLVLAASLVSAAETKDIEKIAPGDIIEIFVWNNAELSRQVTVKMDGSISLPLLGKVTAENMSTNQLEKKLADSLEEFIKYPKVSVIFVKHSSWVVYILGEVEMPGEYDYYRGMTVLELCAKAKGFTDQAKLSKFIILRDGSDGTKERLEVDIQNILEAKKPDIKLELGDAVYVPRSSLSGWNFIIRNVLPSLNFIATVIALTAVL